MKKNFYSLGLMSGTSMDGIDVSIIKSDGELYVELIDDLYLGYDNQLKTKLKRIVDLCVSKDKLLDLRKEIDELEEEITFCHAKVCNQIIKKNRNIKINLIGFHGQTILHQPHNKCSIQIGDPKLLSKLTKISVISNFRKNDIINGGQGAPLSSLYHQLILNKVKLKFPSAIVNIGGISNITYLEKYNKVLSFDTGPGNYLIDGWIKKHTKNNFDNNGSIAKSGKVDKYLLNKLLNNLYYKKKPPKSLDVKNFNLQNLKNLSLQDGSATLSMLTVNSICMAINSFKNFPKTVLISGGGRNNKFIFTNIKKKLKCATFLIDKFNFNGDFIESQAFAYLAIRSYLKKFITLPSTTGVKKKCLGGVLFKS